MNVVQCARVIEVDPCGGDEPCEHEAAAVCAAECPERAVGVPGHRGEDERNWDRQRPDAQRFDRR